MPAAMTERGSERIGILGAGAWGTAIAKVLADKGLAVRLWCREPELADEINRGRTNERFLPGVSLPPLITATADIAEAAEDRDYLFLAIPSLYLLDALKKVLSCSDIREGRTLIAVLTKGFIDTRHGIKLVVDAVEDYLPGLYKGKLVYISGPSHAEEVARGKITGLISASRSGRNSIRFRELLAGGRLVVFSSLDVRGVQISAALKNIVAIAFGMLDALKETSEIFGDNTESLLLAAGLNEILTVGRALGATHPETFSSIAGVGDLDVTCRSVYGRNRRFGREIVLKGLISRFASIDEVIQNLPGFGYIAEGVVAARYLHAIAGQKKLTLPICAGVYRILNREVEPLAELESMLGRISGGTKTGARLHLAQRMRLR
jgi:glycerol-3-phosphate dehydrogenase (NAD(P)+)